MSLQLALDLLPDVRGEGPVLGSTQIHLKSVIIKFHEYIHTLELTAVKCEHHGGLCPFSGCGRHLALLLPSSSNGMKHTAILIGRLLEGNKSARCQPHPLNGHARELAGLRAYIINA